MQHNQNFEENVKITPNKDIDLILNIYDYLQVPNPHNNNIYGNIYLGSVHALLKKDHIKQRKITSILSLLIQKRYQSQKVKSKIANILYDQDFQSLSQNQLLQFNTKLKQSHLHIDISDHNFQHLDQHFDKTYEFIKYQLLGDYQKTGKVNKTGNIFIHCMCGVSRSSSTLIAFLMRLHKQKNQIIKILRKQDKMFKKQLKNDSILDEIPQFAQILKFIRQKRSIVMPNQGFQKQLISYRLKIINK